MCGVIKRNTVNHKTITQESNKDTGEELRNNQVISQCSQDDIIRL